VTTHDSRPILVLGATGKTGRRVAKRLTERDIPVRAGSRNAEPAFERAVQAADVDTTIVRASGFAQNFSESFLLDPILAGDVALPVDGIGEVLDGRNAHLGNGAQQALHRAPRDFTDYTVKAAASGVWSAR
jgi:uncharacterized protein YbjT (DUF2867 family)